VNEAHRIGVRGPSLPWTPPPTERAVDVSARVSAHLSAVRVPDTQDSRPAMPRGINIKLDQ
jgi:hypothetical protein